MTDRETDIRVRAQIALLSMITTDIRAIGFAFEPENGGLTFRVHFEAEPHEQVVENMSCVLTELEAGLSFRLEAIKEEYLVVPPSVRLQRSDMLPITVYHRCEIPEFLPPV